MKPNQMTLSMKSWANRSAALVILVYLLTGGAAAAVVDPVNVGADPSGRRDSCDALRKAVAGLGGGGGALILHGRFRSSCAIRMPDAPVSIIGDGRGVSSLVFTSAKAGEAGLVFRQSRSNLGVTVRDLSLFTEVDQAAGNAAITIEMMSFFSIQAGPTLENLDIRGVADAYFWADGLRCVRCSSGTAVNVVVAGKNGPGIGGAAISPYNAPLWKADAPVEKGALWQHAGNLYLAKTSGRSGAQEPSHLVGSASDGSVVWMFEGLASPNMDRGLSLDEASSDFKIRGLHAFLMNKAIYTDHGTEGIGCNQCDIVGANWGLYNGPGNVGAASQFVTASHFNTMLGAIYAPGCLEAEYGPGNLFYKWVNSSNDWVGIDGEDGWKNGQPLGCSQTQIIGNIFYGFRGRHDDAGKLTTSGTATAIRFGKSADWNDVKNNNATLVDDFIDLGFARGPHNHIDGNSGQLIKGSMIANATIRAKQPN